MDAEIRSERSSHISTEAKAEVPLTAATTGLPLPIDGILDVGIEGERAKGHRGSMTYRASGAQIFAIKYRKLKFARFWRTRVEDVHLENGNRWNVYVGSRREDKGAEGNRGEQIVEVEVGEDIEGRNEFGLADVLYIASERFIY